MVVVCTLIWISSDAKEKSSERVDLPIPGHKDGRYRLSGAFLFVNWDSFQISSYPELTTMTVGELFRKAHAFFQGSEFKEVSPLSYRMTKRIQFSTPTEISSTSSLHPFVTSPLITRVLQRRTSK